MKRKSKQNAPPEQQELSSLSVKDDDKTFLALMGIGIVAWVTHQHALRKRAEQHLAPRPPINAEFLLHLLLRHDEHDALIGDLIERYGKKVARLGVKRANIWFCLEVFWTALPLIKRVVAKTSGLIAAGEWVRRHIP